MHSLSTRQMAHHKSVPDSPAKRLLSCGPCASGSAIHARIARAIALREPLSRGDRNFDFVLKIGTTVCTRQGSCETSWHTGPKTWNKVCTKEHPQAPCPHTAEQGAAVHAFVALRPSAVSGMCCSRVTGCTVNLPAMQGFTQDMLPGLHSKSKKWVGL